MSEATTTPMVSATYEVPTTGLTNSDWDVETDGSNFDIENSAYDVTLTPSAISGDITLTLSSGSFASSDVGKRIVGNGGTAILTATDGSATATTDFTDTSTIASGLWSMYGLSFGANGVKLSSLSIFTDGLILANMEETTSSIDISYTNSRLHMSDNGTKLYIGTASTRQVYQYLLSVPYDISTATYDNKSFSLTTQITISNKFTGIYLSSSGDKLYAYDIGNDNIHQYNLSTAWDVSTASYVSSSLSVASQTGGGSGLEFSLDGTKMYIGGYSLKKIFQYNLSTAWDVSTASYANKFFTVGVEFESTILFDFSFSFDGERVVMVDYYHRLLQYNLSTAWDVSTASYDSVYEIDGSRNIIFMTVSGGSKNIYLFSNTGVIYQYLAQGGEQQENTPTNQYFPAVTNASGQIDTTFWTDINSMTVDEALGGQSAFYAASTDDRTTWKIIISGSGSRNIVRNNSGIWEYNSNTTYGSETWTSATTNTEFKALSEAMTITANKMTGTQLDAVSDSEHFTLETELDLAIILYSSDSTIAPSSDGVAINYDGNIIDTGAVHGTDYTWDTPSTTSVRFTAINAGNFKVRVI